MVAISRSAGSYALIAPVSLKANADALRKVAEAAGNSVSTTQTTLTGQALDLKRFVAKVSSEADPIAALETTRGLARSSDVSTAIKDALTAMEQRFVYTQSVNSSRPSAATGGAGTALVAMLRSAAAGDEDSFDFSALLARPAASKVKPNQINVTAARQNQPDVFDRGIPLTTAVGGSATIDVVRTALTAQAAAVLLDKAEPDLGSIQGVEYVADGAPRSDNDGFLIKAATGGGADTVVLDTRDGTGDDSRLSWIDLSTGEGSDVVFIAGNNISKVDAGAGDDFVAVEGDASVHGGEGDDLLYARNAWGDAGDDVIFSDGFASGGEGDDTITLFSLDPETDTAPKVAYGGAGNDQIVASVSAAIDGGAGDDVLILRDGGSAGGGSGDDTISAYADATIEGGDGTDDILLLKGGSVEGGAGDDLIEARSYAIVSGGQGADVVTLKGGGTYRFAKGDGSDTVTMDKAVAQPTGINKLPMNRIVIDGYAFADMTVAVSALDLTIAATGLNVTRDKLSVSREVLGKMEVVFRKNGQQQVLSIDGLTQTLGAMGPATP